MPRVGAAVLKARYIRGLATSGVVASNTFGVAGLVRMAPIDIPWPIIIDCIVYQVGGTSAGNVRLGMYREGATADSPLAAALVVESASVAQSSANYFQLVTVADTLLIPGQYFAGIQGDNTTGTFRSAQEAGGLIAFYYTRAGAYGAFTDPCPTLTALTVIPFFLLRVKENLPAGYRL